QCAPEVGKPSSPCSEVPLPRRDEVVPLLDWTGSEPASRWRIPGDEGVSAVDGAAEGGAAPSAGPGGAETRGRVPRARPQAVRGRGVDGHVRQGRRARVEDTARGRTGGA